MERTEEGRALEGVSAPSRDATVAMGWGVVWRRLFTLGAAPEDGTDAAALSGDRGLAERVRRVEPIMA